MHPLLLPRAVRPGDLVAVAALSGPLHPDEIGLRDRGVEVLREMGFRVRVTPPVAANRRRWWAAGTPQELADELNGLLRDPEVRAIVAQTGGNVTASYLDLIDVEAVRADPKPIFGYSDISLLHLALHARTGLVGFHADLGAHGFGGDWFSLGDAARRAEL
ncbi:MAG: LD-carboxypeptidase, partial [Streptomycetaceae bacterium]|nr:LD-carboxypeptidase [Streptomycetaceae bacterium]